MAEQQDGGPGQGGGPAGGVEALVAPPELLDAVVGAWRVEALAWVERSAAVSAWLAATPLVSADDRGTRGLIAELALELSVSTIAAGLVWSDAAGLRRFPQVAAAARVGRVHVGQARVVLEMLGPVEPVLADRIADKLLAGAAVVRRPPARLRAWLAAELLAADPVGAAERRQEQTRARTGVRSRPLPDGLMEAVLCGPASSVLGLMTTIDRLTPAQTPGGLATRGQLMFGAVLEAVSAAGAAAGVGPVPVELHLALPGIADGYRDSLASADGRVRPLVQPEPLVVRLDPAGLAHVLAAQQQAQDLTERLRADLTKQQAATAAQAAAQSAAGCGVLPLNAATVEALIAFARSRQADHWPLSSPDHDSDGDSGGDSDGDSDGEVAEVAEAPAGWPDDAFADLPDPVPDSAPAWAPGTGSRTPPEAVPEPEAAPVPNLGRSDSSDPLDPVASSAGRAWRVASVPWLAGYGPIDPGLAAQLLFGQIHPEDHARLDTPSGDAGLDASRVSAAGNPGREIQVRRIITDRTGGACAVDPTPIPLSQILTAPLPQPPPATGAYAFTAAQRRVIQARDPVCTHPGCVRKAHRCEIDHVLRFPDGPTSVGNGDPKCKGHHDLKHHGWTVRRHHDGTVTWTSPSGRHYRNTDYA